MVDLNSWPVQTTQGWYSLCSGSTWNTQVLKAEQELPLTPR